MTSALLKSSKTKFIGRASENKDTIFFKHYILYGNKFNEIKRICKQNYYAEELALYENYLVT